MSAFSVPARIRTGGFPALCGHRLPAAGQSRSTHRGRTTLAGTMSGAGRNLTAKVRRQAVGIGGVIVNPGGTNERVDNAHLQKATVVSWKDNAAIFDAPAQGRADLMITGSIETRPQAKLHPGVLCPCIPTRRGTRLLDAA